MANNIYDYSYQAKRNLQKKISFILIFILLVCFFSIITSSFFIYSTLIKSDSMSPSLDKNNVVFISPFISPSNPFFSENDIYERGDILQLKPLEFKEISFFKKVIDNIVSFFTFQKIAPFSNSNNMTNSPMIRRVIGLPGDTVYVKDYIVYIKVAGSSHFLTEFEVSQKKYDIISQNTVTNEENIDFLKDSKEIILGKNEYFVMSDNRISSVDSRLWGPINSKQIKGKVICRYFPLNKLFAF